MFWTIVVGVIAVVLALAWWSDRRRRHRGGSVTAAPENDAAVGEAKAQSYVRDIDALGPGNGP